MFRAQNKLSGQNLLRIVDYLTCNHFDLSFIFQRRAEITFTVMHLEWKSMGQDMEGLNLLAVELLFWFNELLDMHYQPTSCNQDFQLYMINAVGEELDITLHRQG